MSARNLITILIVISIVNVVTIEPCYYGYIRS